MRGDRDICATKKRLGAGDRLGRSFLTAKLKVAHCRWLNINPRQTVFQLQPSSRA